MIEAKHLSMYYGPTRALDNVSFEAKENEIVGLLGPNGAGKSTLMRILTTFIFPTKGSAKICGCDITQDPVSVRKCIGYLPENPPLYMDMRVDEYIDFVGRARGLSGAGLKDRIDWVIDATQINGVWKHLINELSLGFRQRVGLAQALIHDPKVVILDEPTSGLDPMQIIGIRKLIKELAKDKTIIFSTHILQEASAVADRLLIIDRGRIISHGTVSDLKREKEGLTHFTVGINAGRDEVEAVLRAINTIKEVVFTEEAHKVAKFVCATTSYDESARGIQQAAREKNWFIREIAQKELSLEEVFLALFRKSERKAGNA